MKKSILCLVFLFLFGATFFAQTNNGFKYQAVARDAANEPYKNTLLSVEISILENSVNGRSVYTETHATTTTDLGLLNLTIGKGVTTAGNFDLINWGAATYFLSVKMKLSNETVYTPMGASQLMAVPYALHAKTADNVDDADADAQNEIQTLQLNGNTLSLSQGGGSVQLPNAGNSGNSVNYSAGAGIAISNNIVSNTGDTNPNDDLTTNSQAGGDLSGNFFNMQLQQGSVGSNEIANGSIQRSDLASGLIPSRLNDLSDISASGASNGDFLQWNGSKWTPGSVGSSSKWSKNGNDLYYKQGKVGVGTSQPKAGLHVYASHAPALRVEIPNDGNGSNPVGAISIKSDDSNDHMAIDADEIDVTGDHLKINGNSNSNVLLATGGGKVGIGTDSPNTSLTVAGEIRATQSSNTQGSVSVYNANQKIAQIAPVSNSSNGKVAGKISLYGRGQEGVFMYAYNGGGTLGLNSSNQSGSILMTEGTVDIRKVGSPQLSLRDNKGTYKLWGGYNFHIRDKNNTDRFFIGGNGRVGIGTISPAATLHVQGSAAKPGGGSWSGTSDRRLKTEIKDFDQGLETIKAVRPVTYQYNGKLKLPTDKTYVGVIAQELQEVAPFMVKEFKGDDGETYLNVDPSAFNFILINAVQEQQQMIEDLKAQLAEEKAENKSFEARLAAIEQILQASAGAQTVSER